MDATLAILAGGKGRRLGGVAKGLIQVEGVPILRRQLRLAPLFDEVLFVADDASPYRSILDQHPAVRTISDAIPGKGAPGGVHAALAAARTTWVVAMGCDLPFVSADAVGVLLAERTDSLDAIAFAASGRLHPLLAAYRAAIHPEWGQALAGDPSMRSLLGRFRTLALSEERLAAVDPGCRSVQGINEPADLDRVAGSRRKVKL